MEVLNGNMVPFNSSQSMPKFGLQGLNSIEIRQGKFEFCTQFNYQ